MLKEGQVNEVDQETSLVVNENEIKEVNEDKMQQFRELMNDIISDALKQNNETLTEDISNNVTESVTRR